MSSDGAKLVLAAAKGDDAKVKRLLKAKADVNSTVTGPKGRGAVTALHEACLNGHVGAVRLLLKAKATVDLRDAHGCAALYDACSRGHLECAQLMLEAKATIDLASHDGATSLVSAAQQGHATVVQLLLQAKASTTARAGTTATSPSCGYCSRPAPTPPRAG